MQFLKWLGLFFTQQFFILANSKIILDTGFTTPDFGTDGFDIYNEQSVSLKFFSNTDCILDNLDVQLMSNSVDSFDQFIDITITDLSNIVLEDFKNVEVNVTGWTPTLFNVKSAFNPYIIPGNFYKIKMESQNKLLENPIWCIVNSSGFISVNDEDGGYSSSPGIKINCK